MLSVEHIDMNIESKIDDRRRRGLEPFKLWDFGTDESTFKKFKVVNWYDLRYGINERRHKACLKCGSENHFVADCPERLSRDLMQMKVPAAPDSEIKVTIRQKVTGEEKKVTCMNSTLLADFRKKVAEAFDLPSRDHVRLVHEEGDEERDTSLVSDMSTMDELEITDGKEIGVVARTLEMYLQDMQRCGNCCARVDNQLQMRVYQCGNCRQAPVCEKCLRKIGRKRNAIQVCNFCYGTCRFKKPTELERIKSRVMFEEERPW